MNGTSTRRESRCPAPHRLTRHSSLRWPARLGTAPANAHAREGGAGADNRPTSTGSIRPAIKSLCMLLSHQCDEPGVSGRMAIAANKRAKGSTIHNGGQSKAALAPGTSSGAARPCISIAGGRFPLLAPIFVPWPVAGRRRWPAAGSREDDRYASRLARLNPPLRSLFPNLSGRRTGLQVPVMYYWNNTELPAAWSSHLVIFAGGVTALVVRSPCSGAWPAR